MSDRLSDARCPAERPTERPLPDARCPMPGRATDRAAKKRRRQPDIRNFPARLSGENRARHTHSGKKRLQNLKKIMKTLKISAE